MKDQNKKKLAQYSSLAAALLGGAQVQGQIVHTDIADTTIDTRGGVYDLDLDNDGDPDFRMTQLLDTGATGLIDAITIMPFDSLNSRVAGITLNGFNYPFRMSAGDSLSVNGVWNGNTDNRQGYLVFQFDGTPYPNSNWKGPVSEGFLGLRVTKSDGFHYGWARVDVAADNRSFVVRDYAYRTDADTGMFAGHLYISQIEQMGEDITLGQGAGTILLEKPERYEQLNVRLLDINGRVLATEHWTDKRLTLQTPAGASGVLLVELEWNGMLQTRKVLVRH